MPQPGTYRMRAVTPEEFAKRLQAADFYLGGFESFIGYPDTARIVEQMAGVTVPISREPTVLTGGDRMAVIRLKYRVADPATKGKTTYTLDDFEFFLVEYWEP